MSITKFLLGGFALLAGPVSACPFDGMYGHRFSSLMSGYQRPADSSAADSSDAAQQDAQAQPSSGMADQPPSETATDYGQGEPTYR